MTPPEIINGVTLLERLLADSHPRIFFDEKRISEVKAHMTEPPWTRWIQRVVDASDNGCVPSNALLFLLTDERENLDAARKGMVKLIESEWPDNVATKGQRHDNALQDLALGYDWLHEHLDSEVMAAARECMFDYGDSYYSALSRYEIYEAATYEWNIFMHGFANFATAAFAIYGDVDGVAPWIRGIIEKVRMVAHGMGPDGVSPEGLNYGGFYSNYCTRTFDMVSKLVGWNCFENSEHMRNIPYFYLYSMIGRKHVGPHSVHHCFGDGARWNWHGPDYFLRRLAAEYHDPHAQWAARIQDEKEVTNLQPAFLNMAWYDPSLEESPPDALPTFRHFDDKDMVVMRSGWEGDEAVLAFKCGPHGGHHALKNYQQCVGGGHMAPDAGSFQLHACGDWLIVNCGYARKQTEYHNTVMVKGIGQTGESGDGSEWFECVELRQQRRGPSILRASSTPTLDYVIADVAPAYEPQAGLTKFLRHVIYIRPLVWILVDELQTKEPSTFDLYFHAYGVNFAADRPFKSDDSNSWVTGGENGSARITAASPGDVEGYDELLPIRGTGNVHIDRDLCTLRLRNSEPTNRAVFITVIEAFPTAEGHTFSPACVRDGEKINLSLGERIISLTPDQDDPSEPIWQEETT
jgi:hypothetical protein